MNDIAAAMEIAPNQLSDMLHGRKTFSTPRLKIVAEMIGISHEVLYDSVGTLLTKKVETDLVEVSMIQGRRIDVNELEKYITIAERLGMIGAGGITDELSGEAEDQDADLLEEGVVPDAYAKDGEKS